MIWRFRSYLRPVRWMLVAGLGASVLQSVLQWAAPWPLKLIFDDVLSHHRLPSWLGFLPTDRVGLLGALAAAIVVLAAGQGVANYLANRFIAHAGQRVVFTIRGALFGHLTAQSLAFHQRRTTGDLLARLGGDTQAVQNAMVTAVPTALTNALTLTGMIVIMTLLDWRYTLLTLTLVPVLFLTVRWYVERIKGAQRQARAGEGRASGVAQEVLTSLPVIQAFGAERFESGRYAEATDASLAANRRAVVFQAQFTPIVSAIVTAGTALVVYYGARAVLTGRLTPGDLLVFMAYVRAMYSPVRQISKLAGTVGRAQAAAERLVEILDTDERVPERPLARPPRRVLGALSFDDVGFRYPLGPAVLDGVTLEIPAGTRQALVGATGSGKSTMLRLIPRFLDPTSGAVRLDGVDVRDLTLAGLRAQIAMVPQEPYLFRGTVWQNIVYGCVAQTPAAAVDAARAAGVHDVIAALADGYDTQIAERGASLSGGQRQCIAVARAMARNARILLLDEPTVGLDAASEALLMSAFDRLADGRTTILVSHQLGNVRAADQIAMLDSGRIAELGSHRDLVHAGGGYARLQAIQLNAR